MRLRPNRVVRRTRIPISSCARAHEECSSSGGGGGSSSSSSAQAAGGTEEGMYRQQQQQVGEGGEEGVGEEAWEDGVAGVRFFGASEDGGWKQVTEY